MARTQELRKVALKVPEITAYFWVVKLLSTACVGYLAVSAADEPAALTLSDHGHEAGGLLEQNLR